ncbi:P2X purinoceptor 4 [Hypsibius exemplaris]|uniref:P2X purinoceptor 4 n=1 Tax=Hypsibius exemplaris TaxID=2072580 RepID=A0A9X6NCD8_HYPEX|nr:P2X purinoceptor 4 [Hypsibius exemplaris]
MGAGQSVKTIYGKIGASVQAFFFEYETPRVITMKSRRIGVLYRLVQLALLIYLIGYVFVYSKSYQRFDVADSSVVTKVKGILQRDMPNGAPAEIWDSNDFVVPAQESDAFFVATNLIFTENQGQGLCPEDRNVGRRGIHCSNDTDCPAGTPTPYGNGVRTGRCVLPNGTCEISGWCPTEIDYTPKKPVLYGFDTVTILVKNHVNFRNFGVKRRNILESFSQAYLQSCRFHPVTDPLCPVFGFRDMVTFANESLDLMAVRGGIIGFGIEWNCNLDRDLEECLPRYTFKRLDSIHDKVAKGWNFRHTFYYYDANGKSRRDLVKFWGIRFVFLVNGLAGKFSIVHFLMHVGSSIGLFGIASLVCEVILNYWRSSSVLNDSKFVNLEDLKAKRRMSIMTSSASVNSAAAAYRYNLKGATEDQSVGETDHRRSSSMAAVVIPLSAKDVIPYNDSVSHELNHATDKTNSEWL